MSLSGGIPAAAQPVQVGDRVSTPWFNFFSRVYNAITGVDGVVATLGGYAFTSSTPIANSLAADVLLNNTATYFTGPTVAQGSAGIWFASGTVTVLDTLGAAKFDAKLWDGTTVIASAQFWADSNRYHTVSLSGYIALPAGNIRISVKDATTTSGGIIANASGNGKDSTLTAFRIG